MESQLMNPVLDLAKDYDIAYSNIEQDDLNAGLDYESEYKTNVHNLLSELNEDIKDDESLKKDLFNYEILLKHLNDPLMIDKIIEKLKQSFSNVKFMYLEQSTKEKFLRNLISSKFISVKELEVSKINTENSKKSLKEQKAIREELFSKINTQVNENYKLYTKIETLRNNSMKTIENTKRMLEEIDQLKEVNEKFYSENTDELEERETLDSLHYQYDYGDIVSDSKSQTVRSEITETTSSGSDAGFEDDYLILSSTKNLGSLITKRKLDIEDLAVKQETVAKKIKIQNEIINEQAKTLEVLDNENMRISNKIEENQRLNESYLNRKFTDSNEEKFVKGKMYLNEWTQEMVKLLTKLDTQLPISNDNTPLL